MQTAERKGLTCGVEMCYLAHTMKPSTRFYFYTFYFYGSDTAAVASV